MVLATPSSQTASLTHGWVSTNCGRGTIDILWSCLVTMFLCVYTVIHLPVPHYRGEGPRKLREKIVRTKLVPALICIIAPEILALLAVCELMHARESSRYMGRIIKRQATLTHGFFLDMGGFCLKTPGGRYHQVSRRDLEHLEGNIGLDLGDFTVSQERISDLGKADFLTKTLACVQALWLATQVVSRVCQHEAITLLEVSTSAYVIFAVIAYAAWWKKPQDCAVPVMIPCPEDIVQGLQPTCFADNVDSWKEYVWAGHSLDALYDDLGPHRISASAFPTFFGTIHVASWNFTLPSVYELWMWRASSLYCLACFPLCISSSDLFDFFFAKDIRKQALLDVSLQTILILYPVVRLYMIIEVFISLRALPPSAYDSVQWSSFVPHI